MVDMSTTLELTRGWRAHARKIAEAATTPLVPADYLDLFAPLRAGADLRGRIESVHPETADAATLVIRPGADWAGHVPGQYVRVGIDVDGVRLWRAYSLTHGPRADGRISITVKAVPDGKVSNHIVRDTRPGTLVHLEQAAGEFVLLPRPGRARRKVRLLFVTAGSGITPVIGMLRNLFPSTDSGVVRLARSASYDIIVVHVAPSEPDSIFSATCARSTRRAASAWSRATTTSTASSTSPTSSNWCPTWTTARRSPAARPGCSTRSPPTTRSADCPC